MTRTPSTTTELINAIRACKTDADRARMASFLAMYFAHVAKFNPHHAQLMIVRQVAEAFRIKVA